MKYMKNVAIVYHYLAHYRLPIFQELMNSKDCVYTIYSGKTSEIQIEKIHESYAHKAIEEGGLRWEFLKNKWLFKRMFLWQAGIIKIVMKKEYDAFIFLGSPYHISTWIAAFLGRLKGKQVYYWMHGIYKSSPSFVDYLKMYSFYKIANKYFLYNNRAANILARYNIKSLSDMHVIYNSLNYKETLKMRKPIFVNSLINFRLKYFKNTSLHTVVSIGRLNKTKNIDLLLQAQKIQKDKYKVPLFNIILIGDGDQKDILKQEAMNFGLSDYIHFCGAVYEENIISDIIMHSDLCVVPGNIGLTAIHALSYGTPVISHNNIDLQMPEIEAISPMKNGDLYKYEDANDLALVIERWFNRYPTKDSTLINNCYSIIDDFYNPSYQRKIFDSVCNNQKI